MLPWMTEDSGKEISESSFYRQNQSESRGNSGSPRDSPARDVSKARAQSAPKPTRMTRHTAKKAQVCPQPSDKPPQSQMHRCFSTVYNKAVL